LQKPAQRKAAVRVFETVETLTFSEQPFDRISKKSRALQAHFSSLVYLGIYEFAPQILFYACCRTKYKSRNAAF